MAVFLNLRRHGGVQPRVLINVGTIARVVPLGTTGAVRIYHNVGLTDGEGTQEHTDVVIAFDKLAKLLNESTQIEILP